MANLSKHIPREALDHINATSEEKIIFLTKKRYLQQIRQLHGGKDFITHLCKTSDIYGKNDEEIINALSQSLSLNEIYLYLGYLISNQSTTYVYKSNLEDIKKIEEIHNGQPIWGDKAQFKIPTLWATKNYSKTFTLFFFSYKEVKRHFNPLTHSVEFVRIVSIIFIIGHKDTNLIEIICKNAGADNISHIVSFLQKNYKINTCSPIIIKDKDIRIFDNQVTQTTHEVREGSYATTTLTRSQQNTSTKDDLLRNQIQNREFRRLHGRLELDNNTSTVVGLMRGNPGKIQFKSSLTLEERKEAFDRIKSILGW